MRAAYIEQTGSIDQIIIGDLPMPELTDSEVLVKTIAVSVNFVDTFVRAGGFKTKLAFPFVIGRDAVGTVVKVGTKVDNFKIGDLVWTNSMGYDGRQGTTSEFVAVPKERLFAVPDGVDPVKLVASVHSSATAAILLGDILQVEPDHSLLVEGAAGHVGSKLVSLAKPLGLDVATTSNKRDFAKLTKQGVDSTYDYHQPISNIVETFDYIVDTSGKVDLQANLDKLKLRGQVGLITAPSTNKFTFDVRQMYTSTKSIKGFVISHATLTQLQNAGHLLNKSFAAGKLLDDKILQLPMEQAAKAQKMLVEGQTKNQKIILKMS
ncbi:NADPH:quinone reductase [Companilactobacillus zhachilii]|uniref:NADPH:quinone reductase n=1 Tax=Companilactobacillus zhachilii TaxID=2304606 RepID=A0A386PU00_9LACO|nr:alcohol dehydrogenase catalytic domain-containing protein [Companilactobacillus zhachilii]AYE38329.1 NADPH:quinone reductase [Companilactobacillus zhachilii]